MLVAGEGELLRFADEVVIRNPGAASAMILGRPDSVRISWKIAGSDVSYGKWRSEQVAKAASACSPEALE